MTWLDYAVFGVFAASVLWGAWRGLVREVIGVLGWVIAFLAANLFAGPLGPTLPEFIPTPELKVLAAFLGIFVSVLIVSTLLGLLLSKLAQAVGLGGLNSVLGGLFGVARGVVIVLAVALVAGLTSVPQQAFWRESASGYWMGRVALALKPWLPQTLTKRLRYD
jgi:membrane protein required for colicin V production